MTTTSRRVAILLTAGRALALFSPAVLGQLACATPQNPAVVSGTATFNQTGPLTTITASNGAVINYSSFNIGSGQTVQFIQPSATSVVLNRVTSMLPTTINGTLTGNGVVYLINPAGITFGQGSIVNAANFVAAAGTLSNEDFAAGRNNFAGTGRVENFGRLSGEMGLTLVGSSVANFGTLVSPQGSIVMAAGDRIVVGERGGRVFAQVATNAESASPTAKVGVENAGTISAPRGRVAMGAGDIYATAIRTTSTSNIRARSVEIAAPADASRPASGLVEVSGVIDVRGGQPNPANPANPGETTGGQVDITGSRIALRGATIDASGPAGGGTVRIGGAYQGGSDLPRASGLFVDAHSTINADAGQTGNGGTIILWGSDVLRFFGTVTARGGKLAGNGGLIETSGLGSLVLQPLLLDASATNGSAGTWLLDPLDVTISTADSNVNQTGGDFAPSATGATISAATIAGLLDAGTNVTVTTSVAGAEAGNIVVNNSIDRTGTNAASLTLTADGSITFNAGITSPNGATSVVLTSGNGVFIASSVTLALNGGSFRSDSTGGNFAMSTSARINGASGFIINTPGSASLFSDSAIAFTGGTSTIGGDATVRSTGGNITAASRLSAANILFQVGGAGSSVGSSANPALVNTSGTITLVADPGNTDNDAFISNNNAGATILLAANGGSNFRDASYQAAGSVTIGSGAGTTIGRSLSVTTTDTAGNITFANGGAVSINSLAATGGGLTLTAGSASGTITQGTATITIGGAAADSSVNLSSGGNTTLSLGGPIALNTVNVGGNFVLTAVADSISRVNGGTFSVGGNLSLTTQATDKTITIAVTTGTAANVVGTVALNTTGANGDARIFTSGPVDLAASAVGGSLNVGSSTGSITNSGAVTVGGSSIFSANAASQTINIGTSGLFSGTGPISVHSAANSTVTNQIATVLSGSTVGGNLSVTSATGSITGAASTSIDVVGTSSFTASTSGSTITLNNLNSTGAVTLATSGATGDATITNARALILAPTSIGGNLLATATTGGITQSGAITIGGSGQSTFTANGTSNNIVLGSGANTLTFSDSLASIGFVTTGTGNATATLTAAQLGTSNVGGVLTVTASTGGITQTGPLTTTGGLTLTTSTSGQSMNLSNAGNAIGGAISLNTSGAAGNVTLVNTVGSAFGASDIGGNLLVTNTGGNISRSGVTTLRVRGNAELITTAAAASITHIGLAVDGTIRVNTGNTGGNVTITNATSLTLGGSAMVIGGDLTAAATTGDVTDATSVNVIGTAIFNAVSNTANITLDTTTAGAIGFTSSVGGTGGSATYTRASGDIVLANTDVGRSLTVTATDGGISTATGAAVRIRGAGTGQTATDTVATFNATGANGSVSVTGLRVDVGRVISTADGSLTLDAGTNPLSVGILTAGNGTGSGDAATPPGMTLTGSVINLNGNLTTNRGTITLNGPVALQAASVTISSRYTGIAAAGAFNNTAFGDVIFTGNITSGGTTNTRSLLIRTPNGAQYGSGLSSITLPIVRFGGTSIGGSSATLANLDINGDLARSGEPAVATIFASNSSGLSIFLGGGLTFGVGERFTAAGNLAMTATTATFGDFNTVGSGTFNVGTVTVRRRFGAPVAFGNGLFPAESQLDSGTNLVFGRGLTASNPSGWSTTGSGDLVVIATRSGSPVASADFRTELLSDGYPTADDLFATGSRPADFSTGSTSLRSLSSLQVNLSSPIAGATIACDPAGGTSITDAGELRSTSLAENLADLGIPTGAVRSGESVIFQRTTGRPMAGDTRSTFDRFSGVGLSRAIETLGLLKAQDAAAVGGSLQSAAAAYAQVNPAGIVGDPAGFAAWLAGRADFAAADAGISSLAEHFRSLGNLGLTPEETDSARDKAAGPFTDSWVRPGEKQAIIRAAEARRLGRLAAR